MMTLYHYPISTCSQKVRLVLDQKGLDYETKEINLGAGEQHDPEYVKLNPNHVVPTLVHDGEVLIESTRIIEYLDDLVPEPPMRPADAVGRYKVSAWLDDLDKKIQAAAPVLTFAIGPRKMIIQQPEEVWRASANEMPDPAKRAQRLSVLEHGIEAPEFEGAYKTFVDMLDRMEKDLESQPWLSGETFGLADATALPYVLRLEDLALEVLYAEETRPRVNAWFKHVQALPAYDTAVRKWQMTDLTNMFRENGKELWPELQKIAS